MVKDFNINVTYQGKSHLFQCPPTEFLYTVSKYYEIDSSFIDIYAINKERRRKISLSELADLMKVEIILRGRTPVITDPSPLVPSCGGEIITERIVDKLTHNNILSGPERKYIIDLLENPTKITSVKRKFNDKDVSCHKRKVKVSHKMIQCKPSAFYYRTASSQTDETYEDSNAKADDTDHTIQLPTSFKNSFVQTDVILSHDDDCVKKGAYLKDDTSVRKHGNDFNCKVMLTKIDQCKDAASQTDDVFIPSTEGERALVKLKKLATENEKNPAEIEKLMDASFDDRRHFILLKAPLVAAVREKYPMLFSVNEIKRELDRLFYSGKSEDFMNNIDKYSTIILDECGRNSDIYNETAKTVKYVFTEEQRHYAKAVGSILGVPKLVKEPLNFIKTVDNPCKTDIYPYVDASHHTVQEIYFDDVIFKIIVEDQLLCEAKSFKEAILCFVASFFIFNIGYTESCKNSLIIFEKLYLCANETLDFDTHTEQMIKLLKLKSTANI